MSMQLLTTVGLTPLQAEVYLLLMEHGEVKPPLLVEKLKLTRTNAYKVLDRLAELGLADKQDEHKKFIYRPANPAALAALAQDFRAEATAREEAAHTMMQELLDSYYEHSDKPGVETFTGKKDVYEAYRRQINLQEDLYFIRTNADIPAMGFDTMHEIRVAPSRHGVNRYGILASKGDVVNNQPHARSNLQPTYLDREHYNAPVEWSVTDSSLLIVSYYKEPQAVLIVDRTIALAFRQLWVLLNLHLEQEPFHKKLTAQ
jgi:sugar-specific transcriptional regulator TrmB